MSTNRKHWAIGVGMVALVVTASLVAADRDFRLANAAERQDWQTVRALLKAKVNVNAAQADGATPLHWAAHSDNLDIVDLLLLAGADVNAANDHGVTPLSLACENGNAAVAERLVKAGANVNATLPAQGETVLMAAALSGQVDIVKMLLEHGADVNAKTVRSGQTALMWATSQNHDNVVRLLIERGADVRGRSRGGFTPMLFAAQQGNIGIARILMTAGVGVNADGPGVAPLLIAINSGRVPFALFLLEQGADARVSSARNGESALHMAISIGGRQIGFDPDAPVREPPKKLELIQALLARGADPNVRASRVTLRSITGAGSGLGAEDADNFGVGRTRRGATPFWVAAEDADVPSMRALLEGGADPKMVTDDNTTPLMAAAGLGHGGDRYERFWSTARAFEAVRFLVDHGADVNATSNAGFTALHGTAFVGADAAAEYLQQHGANLNAQDFIKRTPYRIAQGHKGGGMSFVSRPSTAALLEKLGADTSLGPHFNDTERELAQAAGR